MSKNSNPVQAIRQTSKYTIFALLIVADGGFAIAHLQIYDPKLMQ